MFILCHFKGGSLQFIFWSQAPLFLLPWIVIGQILHCDVCFGELCVLEHDLGHTHM